MNRALVCTAVAAMATLLVTPAQADDGKIYPGEMCRPNIDDSNVTHSWGRLKNNTFNPVNFECPVVRDVIGQEIVSGSVWVLDLTPTDNVSCTLGMINPTSGTGNNANGFFSTRSSGISAFSSSPTKLSPFGLLSNITDGYATMICNVPGKSNGQQSGVSSYRIDEDT